MARFRRYRRRRLRFRPVRRRFYLRRRTRSRRRYRRRTNTRSSSRSFTCPLEYVVSLGLEEGSTKPRGFIPLGLSLASLPGFAEYEYTYSRVRVLSASVTVAALQNGTEALPGGYAIAPSHDMVQSQLTVSGSEGGVSLLYRNIGTFASGVQGQLYGVKVGNSVYETNPNVADGERNANYVGVTGPAGTIGSTYVVDLTQGDNPIRTTVPTGEAKPEQATVSAAVSYAGNEYQAEVPLSGGSAADLPHVTLDQLSQVKRYRVKFPSTTKRCFRVRFNPYTFLTGNGPVQGLDLAPLPKYFSARRWMPLQWFSTAAGKAPLSLFGPYIAPLFAPLDVTQPITLQLYYHVRLQFAGQV